MTTARTGSWRETAVASAILALHGLLLGWSGLTHSPVRSEVAHLASGLSHYHFERFDLYRVNPPLVRMVGALPTLAASPATRWEQYDVDPLARSEHEVGSDFQVANRSRTLRFTQTGRWACIPFAVCGGAICWLWARRLYGSIAGGIALILWCFSPYVLGHAATIMPDAHAAAVGLAAWYTFWRWLARPKWERALGAGLVLGLAELSKFTLLVFYPLLPVVWLVYRLSNRREMTATAWGRQAAMLALVILASLYVINLGYLFEGTFRPLGDFRFQSMMFTGHDSLEAVPPQGANRFAGTRLERVAVPLPANFVQGIDTQRLDFERGLPSYLRGTWSERGWWYYDLYALAVKVPLGTCLLVAMALFVTLVAKPYTTSWRDEMVVLAPAAAILVLLGSQSGFSVHSRYAIPALPFLFVWTSKLAQAFPFGHRRLAATVVLALAWSVGSSLWTYPHSLSYFNELAGGPRNGHARLLDSNIDWGQDLLYLKRWLDKHPEARPLEIACCSPYDARIAGIEYTSPPVGPNAQFRSSDADLVGPCPGWHAVNVNKLRGRRKAYAYFLRLQPVATAGYSIYVYQVSLHEANRVRRELGLPELPMDLPEGTTGRRGELRQAVARPADGR